MLKGVIAATLIVLAGGAWLFLDCLNRQELSHAEQLHSSIENARAEASKRAAVKAGFDKQVQAVYNSCQAAADKAKTDYAALIEQTAPRKRGVAVIPPEVLEAAENLAASAKAECKTAYDNSLKNGA